MVEWKTYKLSEIGEVVGGATPSTKNPDYYDGDIAWLTPKDLSTFSERYISKGERSITEVGYKSCSTKMLPANTVIFSSRAPIGYVAIAQNEMCTNQGFKSVVPGSKVNYLFLYYLLKYKKDAIEGMGSGTTFKEVSGNVMKGIEVTIPIDIAVQKRIAAVLDSIDSKIENNNHINRNLLEQARTYFKKLFIDEASSDWKEGYLADLGTVIAGGTPSKACPEYYTEKGIAWITPKDLSNDKSVFVSHGEIDITELGYAKSSATKMPRGSVLFSSRAPIGYIAIAANEVTTNQGFKSVVPNKNVGTGFMYFLLESLLPTIENMASGSTFKEISGSAMKVVPIIIPDNDTLKQFNDFCEPLLSEVEALERQSRILTKQRDALLPTLMSGELDVSELDL